MPDSIVTARGEWLRKHLPNVREDECRFVSKATLDYKYNCVGFVVGDYRWWQPDDLDEYYWPDGVKRSYWAKDYVKALKTEHFERCTDGNLEGGYEKIAVYHNGGGRFTHVAKILSTMWASKLGDLEDIEHPAKAMTKSRYGKLFCYLKREHRYAGKPLPDEYRL